MKKLLLIFIALFLVNCSSRKVEVRKKEETVSVLKENDIRKSETKKIKSDVLKISTRQDINISPRDPAQEMKIVYGNDTLTATNADISISNRKDKERDQSKTERLIAESSKSSEALETDKKEKDRATKRESASWGLNLALILGGLLAIYLLYRFVKTKPSI